MTTIQHFLQYARLALGFWVFTSPLGLAGFSSIYVFGDGVSNTDNAPTSGGAANYYENRFCNGRVFVEVIAGWQGLALDHAKNKSNFGNDSSVLVTNVNNLDLSALTAQQKADSLFIVWANNADFVDIVGEITTPYGDLSPWTTRISQSVANHVAAVETLYNKGVRKILMPNAVDIMQTPFYNFFDAADRLFVRQQINGGGGIDGYNQQFKSAITGAMAGKPGLEIFLPDTFTFFEQVLANPAAYGLVNPSREIGNAGGMDSGDSSLQGAGAQYVFWDDFHPTAKFQMHLASFFQQIISPVKVTGLSFSGGSGQLTVANIPLGRAGTIEGSATLQAGSWVTDNTINEAMPGGSQTNTFAVPDSGLRRFYRVRFPVVWTWP